MKRIISAVLVLALFTAALLAFSACGKKSITIAIPNDPTNEARALKVLEANGIIKLKEGAGITATVKDIAENPYNVKFSEIEAAQLPNISAMLTTQSSTQTTPSPQVSIPPRIPLQ